MVELHPILHLSRGSRSQQPQQLGNNTRSDQYNQSNTRLDPTDSELFNLTEDPSQTVELHLASVSASTGKPSGDKRTLSKVAAQGSLSRLPEKYHKAANEII